MTKLRPWRTGKCSSFLGQALQSSLHWVRNGRVEACRARR
jgi:hypothetical protein